MAISFLCFRFTLSNVKRFLVIASALFLMSAAYIGYTVVTLPDVTSLKKTNPTVTALMEQRADENNTKLRPIRSWASYNNISPTFETRF